MLSQKIAALFALMVFASQGVMGRPAPINAGVVGARQGLGDGVKSSRSLRDSLKGDAVAAGAPRPGLLGNYGLLGTGLGGPYGLLNTGLLGDGVS